MLDKQRIALMFIRNVAQSKTKQPNDIWSTIYHVAQDALDGHILTLKGLGFGQGDEDANA